MRNYFSNTILFFFPAIICALPSLDTISTQANQPDDPYQISKQIAAAQMISFASLYPDLYQLGIEPLLDQSQTRLENPGSTLIPALGSTLFASGSALSPFEHTDQLNPS